jgi:hypothetical protein
MLWPALDYKSWRDTCQTLHRWTQIVGKIRLANSPWINHSWGSTLYVTSRGLTTSVIHKDSFSFSIDFDFVSHLLRIERSDGKSASVPLVAESVAVFHQKCFESLHDLAIDTRISNLPNELGDAVPFTADQLHCTYDPEAAHRFWLVLLHVDRVMKEFRSHFSGKVSPVHFFWGSFDLAVTRFSGRRAPEHPGGVPHLPDLVTREAYSHEVSSCGFWPGNDRFPLPAFYSYAYPFPPGFEASKILPECAYFHAPLREFILPYDAIRELKDPESAVLEFFQTTYEAAAQLGRWDRAGLEESPYLKALQRAG